MFFKIGVLKIFAMFTGKPPVLGSLFNKVAGFPVNITKFLRTPISKKKNLNSFVFVLLFFYGFFCYVVALNFVCLFIRLFICLHATHVVFVYLVHWVFFIRILFIRIPRLKKAKKQELPRNHAQAHVQTDLRIPPSNVFFFQTCTVFFPPFWKCI